MVCSVLLSILVGLVVGLDYNMSFIPSVSPGKAAGFPLPLPISGKCEAGSEYIINSVETLYENAKDLECIYAAGIPLNSVPLGYSYGYLLTALNTAFWSWAANPFYQGDFSVETQCSGVTHIFGWMSIGGTKPAAAEWSLATLNESLPVPLGPNEYPMDPDRPMLEMDFTTNFNEVCPLDPLEDPKGVVNFLPWKNSLWPTSQFIDYAVVVGRDETDGAVITLNKAMLLPKHPNDGAITVLFYATKNFDPSVSPIASNTTIITPPGPNGELTISYARGTFTDVFKRLNPKLIPTGFFNRITFPFM